MPKAKKQLINCRTEPDALAEAAEVKLDVMETLANEKRDREDADRRWVCAECCCPTQEYGQHFTYTPEGDPKNEYCDKDFPDFDDSGDGQ